MILNSPQKSRDERRKIELRWRRVSSGKLLGTKVWFQDGYQRRVIGETVWRCGYYAFGGFEDGPIWSYTYAFNEAGWGVALKNRYCLNDEREDSKIDRTPLGKVLKIVKA